MHRSRLPKIARITLGMLIATGLPAALIGIAVPAMLAAQDGSSVSQSAAKQAANQAQVQAANQQARAAQQALNAPMVARLAGMSADERAAALAQLPPARRVQLEQKLENYAKIPAEQRQRIESQYNRLQALPPERQAVVRQALAEYLSTPGPRKVPIATEMAHLSEMTDQQRVTYMSKPAFRGRFSAQEIQMMSDLHGIVP